MSRFTVAAAQYPIDRLGSWADYVAKLERWVGEAAAGGAALAVFPEYGAMELAALDPATMGDLAGSLASVAALAPQVDALHAALAARHGIHLLAATMPVHLGGMHYVNRARLFAPNGRMGWQDKLVMTRFEREQWHVAAGGPLHLFQTALGPIGVTICYDSEFPLLARALVEAGAEILLVPSCTDSLQGYWRVRIGAQARALEGQMIAIQAPTVGKAAWSPAVDVNRGAAGVYGPPDGDFPTDGVIAAGVEGAPQWLFAEIDLAALGAVRQTGAVRGVAHWPEQPGAAPLPPVRPIDLR
ncbi:carbon-nitrogen hydrolase family protein [Novosphingobium piscinae]|uniref:Carbon-nitrogen hydrolase family protein n=1 Tax=Novosphingobium piscinae TaxID=1507448 RepID=A0A7X1FXW5_9SPHN|nr:carbon-nitrogen hydrolase family protein [Novosphingobium piscinae]